MIVGSVVCCLYARLTTGEAAIYQNTPEPQDMENEGYRNNRKGLSHESILNYSKPKNSEVTSSKCILGINVKTVSFALNK